MLTLLMANLSFRDYGRFTIGYDNRADSLFARGLDLIGRAELDRAEVDLKRAVSIQPLYVPFRYFLAEVYLRQGRMMEAIAEFEKTIAIDPELYPAFYKLGVIFSRSGGNSDAIVYLKRAITINPYYLDAYLKLREIFITIGDYQSARKIDIAIDKLSNQSSR